MSMNRYDQLLQIISYLLAKGREFSNEEIQEVILVANLDHLIKYGRLICDIAKPSIWLIKNLRVTSTDRFDYLSESDRQCLDDSLLRLDCDFASVIKVLEGAKIDWTEG